MSLVYGYDVKAYNDRLLVVARKMAELGSAVLPGTVLVNEIPIRKFPVVATRIARPTKGTNFSEIHSRVGPVVELSARSTGGIRCRTGRAPLPDRICQGRIRAFVICPLGRRKVRLR